jgi:hypothetical protein
MYNFSSDIQHLSSDFQHGEGDFMVLSKFGMFIIMTILHYQYEHNSYELMDTRLLREVCHKYIHGRNWTWWGKFVWKQFGVIWMVQIIPPFNMPIQIICASKYDNVLPWGGSPREVVEFPWGGFPREGFLWRVEVTSWRKEGAFPKGSSLEE